MTEAEARKLVASVAGEAWGLEADLLQTVGVGKSHPWCKRFSIFMAVAPDLRRALIATDRESKTLSFAERRNAPPDVDRRSRLGVLNDLLGAENVTLPGDLGAVVLGLAVRSFLVAPGGYVGSPAFLEHEVKSKAIAQWTFVAPHLPWAGERTQKERRALFEQHCEEPVLLEENGSFTLSFSFFTRSGGVERWSVTGDPTRLSSARATEALPSRTFSPPLA